MNSLNGPGLQGLICGRVLLSGMQVQNGVTAAAIVKLHVLREGANDTVRGAVV